MGERPLLRYLPRLSRTVRFESLGEFPTRVEPLSRWIPESGALDDAFIKRDDESALLYGGNKVRTLEVLFGQALAQGAKRIYATGAFGSNHATATVIHSPRTGLESGALLFPQPHSRTARDNLEVIASAADDFVPLAHWSALPLAMWKLRRSQGSKVFVMAPGGATPLGALGYVSAALELAEQVRAGSLPSPHRIVLGVGSTCTSAGLLFGVRVARELGIAFQKRLPHIVAVRVSPWPVTSPLRIARLSRRTSQLLSGLLDEPSFDIPFRELLSGLTLDRSFIGEGYGRPTATGRDAVRRFGGFGHALDTTYSAKSAAGFLHWARTAGGPSLFWATKSSLPLPQVDTDALSSLPSSVRSWLRRCP